MNLQDHRVAHQKDQSLRGALRPFLGNRPTKSLQLLGRAGDLTLS